MSLAMIYTRLRDSRESRNLRLHGDSQLVLSSVFFCIGLLMMVEQVVLHHTIFPIEDFSDESYHVVVTYLSSIVVFASSLLFYGIHLNGFSPVRSSLSRFIGSLILVICTISVMIVSDRHGFPFIVACIGIPFTAVFTWMTWLNAEDLVGAIRQQRR